MYVSKFGIHNPVVFHHFWGYPSLRPRVVHKTTQHFNFFVKLVKDVLAVDGVQTKVDCTSSYWVVLPVSQALVPCYQASVI